MLSYPQEYLETIKQPCRDEIDRDEEQGIHNSLEYPPDWMYSMTLMLSFQSSP